MSSNAWNLDDPGSRFTKRVEFAISVGDFAYLYDELPLDNERTYHRQERDVCRRYAQQVLADLETPLPIKSFPTGIGRGAEGEAVGLLVDLIQLPGGIFGTAIAVKKLWAYLRNKGEAPTVSLGAAEQLCLAHLHEQYPELLDGDVRTIIVAEAVPPGQPPSELGHTGDDLFTVILQDSDNSRSWAYMIHSNGKILHYSEGLPVPPYTLWWPPP